MNSKKEMSLMTLILLVLVAELLLIAIFIPTPVLEKTGIQERVMTQEFLGANSSEKLRVKTDEMYDKVFNKTGIVQESFKLFIPTQEEQARSKGLENMGKSWFSQVEQRMIAFWTAIYLGVHRVMSLWMWVPGFIPILVAVAYDSLTVRRIRTMMFATTSPTIFGTSKTLFSASLLGPVVYALFPMPVPPLLAPIWCAVIVLALAGILVNWPRN